MRRLVFIVMLVVTTLTSMAQSEAAYVRMNANTMELGRGGRHTCPVYVASKEQMDAIVAYMKGISFDEEKLKFAKLCVQICPLTTIGIGRMAKQFSFDGKRGEFIIYAYDYCVDKEYYSHLREVFTFKSEADKVFKTLKIEGTSFDD